MKTSEIIAEQKKLQENLKDIETAIKALRGSNWKEGITLDKRNTVILLHEQYCTANEALDKFENTQWTAGAKWPSEVY
jgi:hypothetical protein